MNTNNKNRVLIIDFGSQVTQLIARRLREINVRCEIHPFNKVSDDFLVEFDPKAIILSGGPASVTEIESPRVAGKVFELGCTCSRDLLRSTNYDYSTWRKSRKWTE